MAPFFYHPRMLRYHFGPRHPFKPEKLARAVAVLETFGFEPIDPGTGDIADVLRVHAPAYVEAVRALAKGETVRGFWGFGLPDNPPFPDMDEIALGAVAGSVAAAKAVAAGAPLAFNLGGGLHHARYDYASGFCVFNDPAIALSVLLETFEKVAYVDIDLHHGDGVQYLFFDEPRVLTCSIHESGRTLYPGTGFVDELGAQDSNWNVPLAAGTTGEVWLEAFRRGILPVLRAFRPEAIVVQMGADPHTTDPLGHLNVSAQDWLGAVKMLKELGTPFVALGGGGYNLDNVPRMWSAACLTLEGMQVPSYLPEFAWAWGPKAFFDEDPPRGKGSAAAEQVLQNLEKRLTNLRWG